MDRDQFFELNKEIIQRKLGNSDSVFGNDIPVQWNDDFISRDTDVFQEPPNMIPWFAGVVLVLIIVIMMCVCLSSHGTSRSQIPSPSLEQFQAAQRNSTPSPHIFIDVESIRRIVQERGGTSPTSPTSDSSTFSVTTPSAPPDLPPSYESAVKEGEQIQTPPPKYEEFFDISKPV